jgi:hypothetical protein
MYESENEDYVLGAMGNVHTGDSHGRKLIFDPSTKTIRDTSTWGDPDKGLQLIKRDLDHGLDRDRTFAGHQLA